MFADDINLFFFEYKDLETFFTLVNEELQKIYEWFEASKLSLNTAKAKYSLSHKLSRKDEFSSLIT